MPKPQKNAIYFFASEKIKQQGHRSIKDAIEAHYTEYDLISLFCSNYLFS